MKKVKVAYQAAKGRHTNRNVDYMLALVDGVELYAEIPVEDTDDECATYDTLRGGILEQATKASIDHSSLVFWFDVDVRGGEK